MRINPFLFRHFVMVNMFVVELYNILNCGKWQLYALDVHELMVTLNQYYHHLMLSIHGRIDNVL